MPFKAPEITLQINVGINEFIKTLQLIASEPVYL